MIQSANYVEHVLFAYTCIELRTPFFDLVNKVKNEMFKMLWTSMCQTKQETIFTQLQYEETLSNLTKTLNFRKKKRKSQVE